MRPVHVNETEIVTVTVQLGGMQQRATRGGRPVVGDESPHQHVIQRPLIPTSVLQCARVRIGEHARASCG
jgi:hypothetical protein